MQLPVKLGVPHEELVLENPLLKSIMTLIKAILHYLTNFFGVNSYITLFLLIIGFLAIIVMFLYCLMLFLHGTSSENIPVYPYNVILDRIIPIAVIMVPCLTIIKLNPATRNYNNISDDDAFHWLGYFLPKHVY